MAGGKLVFVLGFALLAGVVSSFGRYRTVDTFLARLLTRRRPSPPPLAPKVPSFVSDKTFMKYALGLTQPDIDPENFDVAIVSEAYFNLYKMTGDHKFIASQYLRTGILHHLLDIDRCLSTLIMRLVVVGIAADLEDAIKSNFNAIKPELEKIISGLPDGSANGDHRLPKLLTTLLMKRLVFSFLPKLVDVGYFKDFEKTVDESLVANNDNPASNFIRDIENFRSVNPPSQCRTLEEISRILIEGIHTFPNTLFNNILPIVAKLKKGMDLHETSPDNFPIKGLIDSLKPIVSKVIGEYETISSVDGLDGFLFSVDITLPANPTSPLDRSDPLLQQFKNVILEWIGNEGPLKELVDRLRNPADDVDDDY